MSRVSFLSCVFHPMFSFVRQNLVNFAQVSRTSITPVAIMTIVFRAAGFNRFAVFVNYLELISNEPV